MTVGGITTNALTTVPADMWGWQHGDVGLGWRFAMMIGMVVFWGAVVVFVVWLLRGGGLGVRSDAAARKEEPLELLRRRRADGSISIGEFEQRRALLEDADRPAGTVGGVDG